MEILRNKYVIGAAALVLLITFGGVMAAYTFGGVLIFLGLVFLCESIPLVKFIFRHTGNVLDIAIFGFSVYLLADAGPTVSIGLSVAGILFTVFYKPLLRKKKKA